MVHLATREPKHKGLSRQTPLQMRPPLATSFCAHLQYAPQLMAAMALVVTPAPL